MIEVIIIRTCGHSEKIGIFPDLNNDYTINDETYQKNKREAESKLCLPCLIDYNERSGANEQNKN